MMSTFPYYGGRFNQLQKIVELLSEHKDSFDVVVDVFGGSGKVLLNIPVEWRKDIVNFQLISTNDTSRMSLEDHPLS